jgi:hypothetical protein
MVYGKDSWIYSAEGIILDSEFNSDRLGWKHGDYFKFINVNGKQILIKVEELESFLINGNLKC